MIAAINNWSFRQLEGSLLPTKGGTIKKIVCYTGQSFMFLALLPIVATTAALNCLVSRFSRRAPEHPLVEFAKHPTWGPPTQAAPPIDIGFATAGFQEDGPQGHPHSNWGDFYQNNPAGRAHGPLPHVPDFWNHPEKIVAELKSVGVKHFRFSIDRDRLQPVANGPIDGAVLERYRQIIRLFKANGIEPMITLVHFCDPLYFSWERTEDVPGLVRYASVVCDMLAQEGVQKVVTINEPAVVAFQGWVMGGFPPHRQLDVEGAGRVLENMMLAHREIYREVKARHPQLQIGISHDPIRFRHYHKSHPLWMPIERMTAHYLTEITHSAVMRYFETGKFELRVPFRTNYCFETERPSVDFFALQYYSDPLLQIGLCGGDSVSRVPGERIATYRFRMYPQGLASAIYEASKLGVPIELTEIGMDTGVNVDGTDAQRIEYFGKIFQVIQKALDQGINVRSCYFWTFRRNIEWHEGFKVNFGFHDFDPATGVTTPLPVYNWLAGQVAARNQPAFAVA